MLFSDFSVFSLTEKVSMVNLMKNINRNKTNSIMLAV